MTIIINSIVIIVIIIIIIILIIVILIVFLVGSMVQTTCGTPITDCLRRGSVLRQGRGLGPGSCFKRHGSALRGKPVAPNYFGVEWPVSFGYLAFQMVLRRVGF